MEVKEHKRKRKRIKKKTKGKSPAESETARHDTADAQPSTSGVKAKKALISLRQQYDSRRAAGEAAKKKRTGYVNKREIKQIEGIMGCILGNVISINMQEELHLEMCSLINKVTGGELTNNNNTTGMRWKRSEGREDGSQKIFYFILF